MPEPGGAMRERFLLYLSKVPMYKSIGEEEREARVDMLERELMPLAQRRGLNIAGSIYNHTEASTWRGIQADDTADNYHELSLMIQAYVAFLESKYARMSDEEFRRQLKKERAKLKAEKKKEQPTQPPADPGLPDESDPETEGRLRQVNLTRRERSPRLRQMCIERYGARCAVCGIDFGEVYGEGAEGYIEVHHLSPIANYDDEHEVDIESEETGMRPLCATCHAMIHRLGEDMKHPLGFAEFRSRYHERHNPAGND